MSIPRARTFARLDSEHSRTVRNGAGNPLSCSLFPRRDRAATTDGLGVSSPIDQLYETMPRTTMLGTPTMSSNQVDARTDMVFENQPG